MARHENKTPYALSLVSGILILINGIVFILLLGLFDFFIASSATSPEVVPFLGVFFWLLIVAGLVGAVFGIIIIWATTLIHDKKKERSAYIIILVFSVISIGIGGGFIIGSLLGIIGAALGLQDAK